MKKNSEFFTFEFQKTKVSKDEQLEFRILDMDTLLEIENPKGLIELPHKLDFNVICIIYEGNGRHNIDFESYLYKKGSVIFIAKDQVTSFVLNPKMKCFLIEFTDEFFNLLEGNLLDMFDYMRYSPLLQLDDMTLKSILENIKLLSAQLKNKKDDFTEHIVKAMFQSLLLQLKRERIQDVMQIKSKDLNIYNDFMQLLRNTHKYTLKVEDYAKNLQISSKTLTEILKKYTHKTAKTHLNEYLLLEIKRYLLNEKLTLQAIADKLEFDEITNVVKFFKKAEGCTPLEFKSRYKR